MKILSKLEINQYLIWLDFISINLKNFLILNPLPTSARFLVFKVYCCHHKILDHLKAVLSFMGDLKGEKLCKTSWGKSKLEQYKFSFG